LPRRFFHLILLSALSTVVGCAAYAVPGHGANFRQLGMSASQREQQTDPSIKDVLSKKPLASFPATVAIVRIQDTRYANRTVQTYGNGSYCVVLSRDVEKPELIAQIAKQPLLANLEPINRLELPENLTSADDLRAAAAQLHADMLLIYTFDDDFNDQDLAAFMTILTIGISPNKSLTVTSTASAVLMDVRNGYIYGGAEATEKKNVIVNCWGEDAAAESVRQQVEGKAFAKLCGEFQKTWGQVVQQYTTPASTKPTR
jgi:hypothetical protein